MQSFFIIKKLTIFIILGLSINQAYTAQIVVNSSSGESEISGLCTLRAAINSANMDQSISSCSAGQGEDTIILPANSPIS